MRKFFVMVLMIISTQIAHAFMSPKPVGTGLLKKAGSIDINTAKQLLASFVTFSDSVREDGKSDVEFLSEYIRTDIPGYPLSSIRDLVLDRMDMAAGKQLDEEGYYDLIEGVTSKEIKNSFWKETGTRSLYIYKDGSGKIGWWIPKREKETILMLGDEPMFGLYCLNPLGIPPGNTDAPDEMEEPGDEELSGPRAPAVRRSSRNSGGATTATGTGTNNSTATNTNNVTVYVENRGSETPAAAPVVVERKRSGLLEFLGGVALGYAGGRLSGGRYYNDRSFYSRGGSFHPRGGYRPQRSSWIPRGRRIYSNTWGGGGGNNVRERFQAGSSRVRTNSSGSGNYGNRW